jgi:hypothetical protein
LRDAFGSTRSQMAPMAAPERVNGSGFGFAQVRFDL